MSGMKKMKKTTKSNLITYGLVIGIYLVTQILIMTGSISSLLQGLLVPLCSYVILAVSLNLTVGILGELSLGHAGFMCVGAFTSAFFSKCMVDAIPVTGIRYFLALLIGAASAGIFGILIGIPVLRLKGDYLAIVTLAFGEIIKNVVNILFIGRDSNGFHFSNERCDVAWHGAGRTGHHQRSAGDHGNSERFHVHDRCDLNFDHIGYRAEYDPLPERTCDHGGERQPDRSGIDRDQCDKIQTDGIFRIGSACRRGRRDLFSQPGDVDGAAEKLRI